MKRLLTILIALLVFASPAFADYVAVDGLTAAQKASLEEKAAQMKKENLTNNLPSSPKQFQEWAEVGTAVGKGLVSVAKEIGVEANAFATTPLGKISIGLLIWKVMGNDIIQILLGAVMFLTFIPMWVYFFRRLCVIRTIEQTPTGEKTWYGRPIMKTKVEHYPSDYVDGTRFMMLIVLAGLIGTIAVTTFA